MPRVVSLLTAYGRTRQPTRTNVGCAADTNTKMLGQAKTSSFVTMYAYITVLLESTIQISYLPNKALQQIAFDFLGYCSISDNIT